MDALDQALAFTLLPENDGGPMHVTTGDPGGATHLGVTLATLRDYHENPRLGVADLAALTPASVKPIYGTLFWARVAGDQLPESVALSVFDFGVTCGPVRSVRALQAALGFTNPDDIDGWVGRDTIAAARVANPYVLLRLLAKWQVSYYSLLTSEARFLAGWLARTERRETAALNLL